MRSATAPEPNERLLYPIRSSWVPDGGSCPRQGAGHRMPFGLSNQHGVNAFIGSCGHTSCPRDLKRLHCPKYVSQSRPVYPSCAPCLRSTTATHFFPTPENTHVLWCGGKKSEGKPLVGAKFSISLQEQHKLLIVRIMEVLCR